MSISSISSAPAPVLPQPTKVAPDGDSSTNEAKETRSVILGEKFNGGFTPTKATPTPVQTAPTQSGLSTVA